MQISAYSQSATMRNGITDIQTRLADLQRQLSTGLKADNFMSLGEGRNLVLALNNEIAQSNAYINTINLTDLRMKATSDVLGRIDQISSEMKTGGLTSTFDLVSNGQTNLQVNAASRLNELVDLLNTSVADRQLFSGKTVQTTPVSLGDLILNGEGGRAGLKQVISERNQADLGNGLGRVALTSPSPSVVHITENAGPFGFKLASASSNLGGVVINGPTGNPAQLDVDFDSQPQSGEKISIVLDLPDGTQTTISLTATNNSPAQAGQFTIGADINESANNLLASLDTSLRAAAGTVLKAASTAQAGNDFFNFDASNPPQRVDGPPFDTATALKDATTDDTIYWYKGDNAAAPGNNFVATIGEGSQMAYGARADQTALRSVLKNTALLAAVSFSGTSSSEAGEYAALTQRTSAALDFPAGTQSVQNILTDLGLKTSTLASAKASLQKQISTGQSLLDNTQNADPYDVATKLTTLMTQLQASYQVTATLSRLTLSDYL